MKKAQEEKLQEEIDDKNAAKKIIEDQYAQKLAEMKARHLAEEEARKK